MDVHYLFTIAAHKHWQLIKERLREEGIPCSPRILFEIDNNQGKTQKELAKLLGITPASVTNTIDKLESLGYIYRQSDDKDLRVKRIYITKDGQSVIKKAEDIKTKTNEQVFGSFTEEEKKQFGALLQKLVENMEAMEIE